MRDAVELHQAFFWICPECGDENFVRPIRYEASDEEIQELRQEHGIQPWEQGKFWMTPSTVLCRNCQQFFDVGD